MPKCDELNLVAVDSPPTKQERIEFLKQVVAFSETNIRSYDIKAQISLAAFVLSANPLVGIIIASCGPASRSVLVITLILFVAAIFSHLWVLWPVAPPPRLIEGLDTGNLFYLRDPLEIGGRDYAEKLKSLALEPELVAEALKLSYIRKVKAVRFKAALIVTITTYLCVVAAFFGVGRCAF